MAHLHQPVKNDGVLEIGSVPDQIRRILIGLKSLHQTCYIAATAPFASGIFNTEGKIAGADLKRGVVRHGLEGVGNARVDQRRCAGRIARMVGKRDEVDVQSSHRG